MEAIVRDDIIKPEKFVKIAFYYEKHLRNIYEAGGYVFVDQLMQTYGEKEGRYIIRQLNDEGFIKTDTYGKYKVARLTETSIKYFSYTENNPQKKLSRNISEKILFASAIRYAAINTNRRFIGLYKYGKHIYGIFDKSFLIPLKNKLDIASIERDVNRQKNLIQDSEVFLEKMKKTLGKYDEDLLVSLEGKLSDVMNKISVINTMLVDERKKLLNKIISQRVKKLENSLIPLLEEEMKIRAKLQILKPIILSVKEIENRIPELKTQYKTALDRLDKANRSISELTRRIQKLVSKLVNCYRHSQIACIPSGDKLYAIIIDTGTTPNIMTWIKKINDLRKTTGLNDLDLVIILFGYSKSRTEKIINDFERMQEKLNKALEQIKQFDNNHPVHCPETYKYPEYYIKCREIVDNIPQFTMEVWDDAYYIERYKNYISSDPEYLRNRDRKKIEELNNELFKA